MENVRAVPCNKCGKSVPISEIKYVARGNGAVPVCAICREGGLALQNKKEQKKKEGMILSPEKREYTCSRCYRRFNHNPFSSSKAKCPLCGRTDTVSPHRPLQADDLLRSLE